MRQRLLFALLLLATIGAAYADVGRNGFTNFDDNEYVSSNEVVQRGLSVEGFRWAFQGSHVANWHPLTWLSHMVDVELFGLDAAAHHWANVAWHAVASLLLLAFAWRCGASPPVGFLVAALFAVHPLHVESVAWIAERKDTLSAALGLASLHFYLSAARSGRRRDHLLCFGSLALGLLAKPMLVTLPAVFVLLDLWLFERRPSWTSWFVEKAPYWLAVLASSAATIWAQGQGRALEHSARIGFADRLSNAAVQSVNYLGHMLWPTDLAVFYPHPALVPTLAGPSMARVVGSALLLVAITAGLSWLWRRRAIRLPLLGWLFYLGTLVPVIGLLQVGPQAAADRYTYLPSLGILAILAAAVSRLESVPRGRWAATALALLLVAACIPPTRAQVAVWRDSETLWRHALAVTDENWMAHNNLGNALSRKGRKPEARSHYEEAVRILPDYAMARFNLGNTLIDAGEVEAGLTQYRRAIELDPKNSAAMNNLGNELARRGDFSGAAPWFERALRLSPDLAEARMNLGWSLLLTGRREDARPHFEWLVRHRPENPRGHHGLAQIYLYQQDPRCLAEARSAVELSQGRDPQMLETLARALGASGQQQAAVQTLRKAVALYEREGRTEDAQRLNELLARSRDHPDTTP